MKQVSEYFKEKPEKTLDELEGKLTPKEIQGIIYSHRVIIQKEQDGKIHFNYLKVSKKAEQEVSRMIKSLGLTDIVTVPEAIGCTKRGMTVYRVKGIEEVPELSKYLKSSQGKSHTKRSS